MQHKKGLILGVAADSAESFLKRDYDTAINIQVLTGVMKYCGIENASLELLHDSLGALDERTAIIDRARELGAAF